MKTTIVATAVLMTLYIGYRLVSKGKSDPEDCQW